MPKDLEFEFRPDGSIVGIYDDTVHELMQEVGKIKNVDRASTVEWEERGWVVRSAKRPEVRLSEYNGRIEAVEEGKGETIFFISREEALKEEVKRFWSLLAGEETI